MNDQITPPEREALDQLGRNFDALLARTPEQSRRADRRRFVLAGVAAATGMLALIVWAAWPGDSTVDSALGGIADIAAQQKAPEPTQYVESETVTTQLANENGGGFYTSNIAQHVWLSMARPGVVETRSYLTGSRRGVERNVLRTRPTPVYRIAGEVYKPTQIAAFADNPEELIANIDAKADEVPARFRPPVKWKLVIDPLRATSPPLPSSIRAALIRELEDLPGVNDPVERRDPKGREGLELKLDDESLGATLGAVFDPDNAQILHTSSVIKDPSSAPYKGAKVGQVFSSYLLVSSRVVDSAPQVVSKSR